MQTNKSVNQCDNKSESNNDEYTLTLGCGTKSNILRINLFKGISLFDAVIENDKIKVNSIAFSNNDSLLDLFRNMTFKYNQLIIPKFITIQLNFLSKRIYALHITQDIETYPKMYPCKLVLNHSEQIRIGDLSIRHILLQNGRLSIVGHLITKTIISNTDISAAGKKLHHTVSTTGFIQMNTMDLSNMIFSNHGKIASERIKIQKSEFNNIETGIIDVNNFELSDTSHINNGYLTTKDFCQTTGSLINEKSGTWSATSNVCTGPMLFTNHGTINWEKLNFNLVPKVPVPLNPSNFDHCFLNSGAWTLMK